MSEYMKDQDIRGSVTSYCKKLVENVLDRTMEDPGNTVVVGGDWNSNWHDSKTTSKTIPPSDINLGATSWTRQRLVTITSAEVPNKTTLHPG
jgi:hypothetical protein